VDARDVLKYECGILNIVDKAGLPIKNGRSEGLLDGKFIPGFLKRGVTHDAEKVGLFNDAAKLLKKLNDIVNMGKESGFNNDRKLLRGGSDARSGIRHIE
jgi:hypothetical protein